ncbi:Efflux transport system, outer membrane factor lipoprotein [Citrifermentans bremense]|uniref:Efflux transport system, outer membrane factor lipoprotein n=1 Tax=Citrifermentans bremense TaxID=60035 RepID=A0A6S6M4T9_9BACT|nr:efflux transporter outer membrane subunit [Citrifermentans bremense]BCG48748.1 Efflux transport system, outer membrane factor lipoprotein [Citrifermentans bremense]
MRHLICLVTLCCLSGCMVGPDYVRPDADAPAKWRYAAPEGKEAAAFAGSGWWESLGDPVLNDLVSSALRENKDLRLAAVLVEEFAAKYGIARADLFPQAGAGAQYARQKNTERGGNALPAGYKSTLDSFSATVSASWELDLWGRIRRGTEAARAQYLASEEGRQAVVLSLVSSVVASYVNLRNLDRQFEIGRETAESRRKTLEVFDQRYRGGVISEIELTQTKLLYEDSLAALPQFEKAVAQQENALNLLLGRNPGPVPRSRSIDQLGPPEVPAGLPSELLARRPDIRQAEQELVAANAQIGIARAAYFPAITLTGMFGGASAQLSDLFTGPARVWSYSVPVSVPVFTAGKISGSVKVAEAQREQALVNYRQVIQNAFKEVEDALVDRATSGEQLAVRKRELGDLEKYLFLANMRYENGYSSYLEVLDAERNLFSGQLAYVQSQAALLQAAINLYKVMGGDWVEDAAGRTGKGAELPRTAR